MKGRFVETATNQFVYRKPGHQFFRFHSKRGLCREYFIFE
jgi:hypothetical protein